jgi:thiol-disulfide isomerase/thioredoxin
VNVTKRDLIAVAVGAVLSLLLLLTAFGAWSLYAWRKLDARAAERLAAERERTRPVSDASRWQLTSVEDGTKVPFSDLGGRVLLVTQWATWCEPCVDELPSLAELAGKYGKETRFAIVMISTETREHVKAYLATHPYGLSFYVVEEGMLRDLATSALPRTTLLDCRGKVVRENWGKRAWGDDPEVRAEIDRLLERCRI